MVTIPAHCPECGRVQYPDSPQHARACSQYRATVTGSQWPANAV